MRFMVCYVSRPDVTSTVDWALKTNYLFIYLSILLCQELTMVEDNPPTTRQLFTVASAF